MSDSLFAPAVLAGRVALVTGASSGLGAHFAELLARHGARVFGAARRADRLATAAPNASGGTQEPLALDVTSAAAVEAAVAAIVERAGRLDLVVNNAGITATAPALDTGDDAWDAVIDTNLSGCFRVARAAARVMQATGGGAIVNIASILGLRVAKQVPAYVAAKAGLIRLTEALALEWAVHGIRVNALAPGYVVTDLNREFLASPAGEAMKKRIPQRRFGEPADLDGALLLFLSDAGRAITGATLTVDGGHTLPGP
ncbi:MAG: SDR family oxidoreductase [Proteobacteria bacterium]|nr:SDR family oxidoreductase [Pseudomonadota bacterium]